MRNPVISALIAATFVAVLSASHMAQAPAAPDPEPEPEPPTYTNPLMSNFADAFSDAGLIRAKDGYWYAFATNTILTKENQAEGGPQYLMPIARTADMLEWEYVGQTFSEDNHPEWPGFPAPGYWAPDVSYVDGEYYMYYSAPGSTDRGAAIGLATAPTPAGPWTDIGSPVVNFVDDSEVMEIDPALFIDDDGTKYLYYGSFRSHGMQVVELSADGTEPVGDPIQVVAGSRGEAPWVVKRGDYYYLFYSGFGCCNTGAYPVFVGRATSPTGPFLDAEGISLTATHPGGTIVNSPNGNNLVSTGHNAITTDRSGQDWNFSNSFERDDPDWGGRPLAMDRLDWIDGWPTVRAGLWTSNTPQEAPRGTWDVGSTFNDESTNGWSRTGPGAWHLAVDPDSGGHLAARSAAPRNLFMLSDEAGPATYRAEADLRIAEKWAEGPRTGRAGLAVGYQDESNHVIAWLDPGAQALRVEATVDGKVVARDSAALYEGFSFTTWNAVSAEVRGAEATFEVSSAMGGSALAQVSVELPTELTGSAPVGVVSHGGGGQADNVGITELYEPVTERVPEPEVGAVLDHYSDDFTGDELDEAWSQEHGEVDADIHDDALVWDTQAADLRSDTPAGVLLRDAPEGTYTVETKVHLPMGDGAHDYPRAGLIAWSSPEDSLHLAPTSTGYVRQAFLWPGTTTGPRDGDPEAIQMGPSADTMWLRLRHTVHEETGEHLYQGATSLDGDNWQWGSVWFLPPSAEQPRIGLVSMGGEGFSATFDYVQIYGD